MERKSAFDGPAAIGVVVLVCIFASVGLVAAGGWSWFAGFLMGTAAQWVQSVGSVAAILVGFAYVDRQNENQRRRDRDVEDALALRRLLAVKAVCSQASEVVAWMGVASIPGEGSELPTLEFAAEEALAAFKEVSFADIPDDSLLTICGAVRKDLVSVLIHCRAAKEKHLVDSRSFLDGHRVRLEANLDNAVCRVERLVHKLPPAP